jgi:hypothetical protein
MPLERRNFFLENWRACNVPTTPAAQIISENEVHENILFEGQCSHIGLGAANRKLWLVDSKVRSPDELVLHIS